MGTERWGDLYRLSLRLGARYLVRRGYLREAVIRLVVPMDPIRYVELPWARAALAASPGERILDIASPKLLAVALAASGAHVTSVDVYEPEVTRWQRLTEGRTGLAFEVADARALPYPDDSFDHAYSVSVIEHVDTDEGDSLALAEIARCVRPGGRVVLTLPFSAEAFDEYRPDALYGTQRRDERGYFFQRHYDWERVAALVAGEPRLRTRGFEIAGLSPDLATAYDRTFPLLVPLGPLFGLLARKRAKGGTVARVLLERV
ncbi:MAG: methyltransferase domain-containing protein [Gaiellales bacterium]